jgi:hypothetical protein
MESRTFSFDCGAARLAGRWTRMLSIEGDTRVDECYGGRRRGVNEQFDVFANQIHWNMERKATVGRRENQNGLTPDSERPRLSRSYRRASELDNSTSGSSCRGSFLAIERVSFRLAAEGNVSGVSS